MFQQNNSFVVYNPVFVSYNEQVGVDKQFLFLLGRGGEEVKHLILRGFIINIDMDID